MPAFLLAAVLAAVPAEPPATAPDLTPAQAELLQKIKRLRDGDSRHLHIQPSPPRAEALQLV